jgi:hypothetical protein
MILAARLVERHNQRMDQPSWQRHAEEQAEGDRAAMDKFARDAERRQAWRQWHALDEGMMSDPFDDGRAGLTDTARPLVYHYLIIAAVIICGVLFGALKSCGG